MNKFEFDPIKHIYSINGVKIPSATQVIGRVLYPNEFRFVDEETMERASETWKKCSQSTLKPTSPTP